MKGRISENARMILNHPKASLELIDFALNASRNDERQINIGRKSFLVSRRPKGDG